MKKKIYINVGDVFGRLTILEELPINKNRIRKIYVKCDCGTLKIVNLYDVIHRKISSFKPKYFFLLNLPSSVIYSA